MAILTTLESLKLIKKHGIRVADYDVALTKVQAKEIASKIGYPIALKIISKKISHKTETGAVKISLRDEKDLEDAFDHIRALPGFEGAIVQKMLYGHEIIIGGKHDFQFGPTILFGLGGIFVEIFKDYSLRICPITRTDARKMIREIKGIQVLQGARGREKANLRTIEDTLLKTSKMLMKERSIKELDINPLIATPTGVVAVDARIVI